jgi:hypothetical protein
MVLLRLKRNNALEERLKSFFRATHIPAYLTSHALKPISVQVSSRVVRFIRGPLMGDTGIEYVDGEKH